MIVIFWLCVIGLMLFLERICKINNKISLPITFSSIGIILFLAGILNILKVVTIGLYIFGIASFIVNIKYFISNFKTFIKNPINIIVIILYLYITILSLNLHLIHYDNFSHWALIVKSLFTNDRLPNLTDTYIGFKAYQPGSALFIYFAGFFKRVDSYMILGQNYLTLSFLVPLLKIFGNSKSKIFGIIIFYLFSQISIYAGFNNLLVDGLLSLMSVLCILLINKKYDFLSILILSIYMVLIKNVGIILMIVNLLYMVYIWHKNHELKKKLKYVLIFLCISVLFVCIWFLHVALTFKGVGLHSKHSLTNMSIHNLGFKNTISFIFMYIKNFISVRNTSLIYIVVINIISYLIYLKDRIKSKVPLVINAMYIIYYILLGFMYILSMPYYEVVILAGFERYMQMIIIIIVGIFMFYLFNKNKYVYVLALLIIPILCMNDVAKTFVFIDDYKNTLVYQLDHDDINYVYNKDNSYLSYLSVYKEIKQVDSLDEIKGRVLSLEELPYEKIKDNVYLID